jgi:hypothetical protein
MNGDLDSLLNACCLCRSDCRQPFVFRLFAFFTAFGRIF